MVVNKEKYSYSKEYKQEYYQKNKERIKELEINNHRYDPIFCEICNKTIKQMNMPAHLKTKNHTRMKEIEIIDDKIKCKICNSIIVKASYKRHTKSKKHIENINLNNI